MPIITVITATDWTVDHDIESPANAAQFTARYTKVDGVQVWDPAQYNTIKLYRGEADPDLVEIRAVFDGEERQVMLGVVDRSGRDQTDKGVVGTLTGRDRMALILDGYTTAAFTIDGITVSGETVVVRKRFGEAVIDLAQRAGLTAMFHGLDAAHDYAIGRSIPVTTDMTFGEILEELLGPLRLSRRHSFDAWVEGTTLHVAKRGSFGVPITVNFERLIVDNYDKTVRPTVADVQVLGATYEVQVNDPSAFEEGCPGILLGTVSVTGSTLQQSFVEDSAEHKNAKCQITAIFRTRRYNDLRRTETWVESRFYVDDPTSQADGNLKTATEEHYVTDHRDSDGDGIEDKNITNRLIHRKTTVMGYYADNGDTRAEDVDEVEFPEVPLTPDNPTARKVTTYRHRRSRGQIVRDWTVTEMDNAGGVTRTVGSAEVGPLKLSQGLGSVVPFGRKQETRQISCGADTARKKESNELIGDAVAACAIRADILDDHAATRIKLDITVRLAPDHRVKPGRTISVAGAPAWWDATSFVVLSSQTVASDRGAEQEVRAVAYL